MSHTAVCDACQSVPSHLCRLCPGCRADFERQVRNLPALRVELEDALERRRGGHGAGGGAGINPGVPINVTASLLLSDLNYVTRVLRNLVPPSLRPRSLCDALPALVLRDGVGEAAGALWHLYDRASRLQDPPAERVSIGQCACGHALMAPLNASWHQCPQCGTEQDVQARLSARARLRETDFADRRLSAAQVQEATAGRIKAGRVRQWVHRGRIAPDETGRVLFGDVLALEAA